MKSTTKKAIIIVIFTIIIVLASILYLKPISLTDIINSNSTLLFTKIELGVKDGSPYHNSTNYNDITDEQTKEILQLLNNYSYARNIKTVFSDGSMTDNAGDGYFYITIYNETNYEGVVVIAYDNEISVNDKNYTMKNSEQFINEILAIISE